MKTPELIDMVKHLVNISNRELHPCLYAAVVYFNWTDCEILYDSNHIIVKLPSGEYLDDKGIYTGTLKNFIGLREYGCAHTKASFFKVDWDNDLYSSFLKNYFNED